MDPLTRQEALHVLSTLGIELPPQTKLPDTALLSRIDLALKSSQELPDILPSPSSPTLKISSLADWPTDRLGPVMSAMHRTNMAETYQSAMLKQAGMRTPTFGEVVGNDVFNELRRTVFSLAQTWDQGVPCCVVQDAGRNQAAINVRVLEAKRINDKTPVLVVLYASFTKANLLPGTRWVKEKMPHPTHSCSHPCTHSQLMNINADILEQKLLLYILDANSAYIPSTYKPNRTATEGDFKVSLLFPTGPLSFDALGKLNLDTGCAICGEKSIKKCANCQSVGYCGRECQAKDWSNHKGRCKSLKGGTWRTIKFSLCIPGFEDMFVSNINRLASTTSPGTPIQKPDPNIPPPNIHGNRVFLIKMQFAEIRGTPQDGGPIPHNMMVYDRKRSIDGYFVESASEENKVAFGEFNYEMKMSPRGTPRAAKMYRYAKRVGDWELSVCLDKLPQETIKW